VLLHLAALLTLAALDFDRPVPARPSATLELQLLATVATVPAEPDPASALERDTESSPPAPKSAAAAIPRPSDNSIEDSIESATGPPIEVRSHPGLLPEQALADDIEMLSSQPLHARVLQQIERSAAPEIARRPGGGESVLQGRALPRLPSARGWLSGHVGAVAPEVDSWREADGRQRAQVTLADGTIVCMERRAPTVEEMMQPWKSTIVTMSRLCGKARPAPVDYSDPRVQPPPRPRGGN
jgi:hypothetical protein